MTTVTMQCILACIVFSFICFASGTSVNYCGSKMCQYTNTHTFCQYLPGPGPDCSGYIDARLSIDEKARIIGRMNRRRSEAAQGLLKKLPPAGNMVKLRWVEELARQAQLWADQCRPSTTPEEHDECRDLYSISVGQCVASVIGEAPGLHAESMVDMWYMQSKFFKGNVTSYQPPTNATGYYGDFAQMVWARTYMVGCGRSRFMAPWKGRLRSVERLVCNFAPKGPIPTRSLWSISEPATTCPARSRPDTMSLSLCNYQYDLDESDDVDSSMLLQDHILLDTVLQIELNESLEYQGSLDELFLTKVAIATIEDTETTMVYSIRNEYNEHLENEENGNALYETESTVSLNKTTVSTTVHPKFTKKKISLIGRPKSYNMEELNDVGGVSEIENVYNELLKEKRKAEKDFYTEYEFHETHDIPEQNISNALETFVLETVPMLSENVTIEELVKEISSTRSYHIANRTIVARDINSSNIIDENKEVKVGINISREGSTETLQKPVEDYLNDPETIRQLQEALDRMEQESASTDSPSGKVRRELRESPTDVNGNFKNKNSRNEDADDDVSAEQSDADASEQGTDTNTSPEEKNTTGETPMLNMMFRYMPYLKQYQSSILANAVSKVNKNTSDSLVFILCLAFALL